MVHNILNNTLQSLTKHPLIGCFLLGLITAFSLPPWGLVPLFAIGFSGLLYVLHHTQTTKRAFFNGCLFGFGYYLIGLYWISNALLVHIDEFWWAYPFALVGLPLFLSLFYGLASYLTIRYTALHSLHRFVLFLTLITVIDHIRGYIFTGFPWNTPGLIWIDVPTIAQAASIGGLELLSALTFLWASLLFVIPTFIRRCRKTAWGFASFSLVCFLICAGYGALTLKQQNQTSASKSESPSEKPAHRIVIVQPNIPQIEKWDPKYIERNFIRHINLTAEALQKPAKDTASTIVVWPETAISYSLFRAPAVQRALQELSLYNANQTDTYLITGILDRIEAQDALKIMIKPLSAKASAAPINSPLFTNSLIAMQNGKTILRYDKHHLVPFGEYMPLQDYLGGTPLVQQVGGFEAGNAPRNMTLPNGLSFLPLICYEIIFPKHSFAATNSDFIINITNDGWYGDSAGPAQHLALSRFRAIEQKRPVLRAANTGVSAVIDLDGTIIKSIPYGQTGTITYNFSPISKVNTPYQRFHYFPLIVYFSSIFLFFCVLKRKIL